MTRQPIILVGAGGHARSCIDVVEESGEFEIFGLIGLPETVGGEVLGYPVVGDDSALAALREKADSAMVTVGQIRSPATRIRLFEELCGLGFKLPTVVSPRAHVSSHARIGQGSIIMHGAVVNAGSRIGENCIINSLALVEHDARIGDHCHISTGATVNGEVNIGRASFLGSRSVVRQGVTVPENSVIPMASAVFDTQNNSDRQE